MKLTTQFENIIGDCHYASAVRCKIKLLVEVWSAPTDRSVCRMGWGSDQYKMLYTQLKPYTAQG